MSKVQSFYFCFYFVWEIFYGPSSAPQKAKGRTKKMYSNLQCSLSVLSFTVTAINLLTTVHPICCRSLSLLLFALDALTPLPTLSVCHSLDLSHCCTLHSALSAACSSIFRQFIRIVKGEQCRREGEGEGVGRVQS